MGYSDTPSARFLVLAPLAGDKAILCGLVAEAGQEACQIGDPDGLSAAFEDASGAILTQEALTAPMLSRLAEALAREPEWASLPILLLATDEATVASVVQALRRVKPTVPIWVVLRPAARVKVLTAIESAVAARATQMRIGNLLAAHRHAEERANFLLRELNHRVKNVYAVVSAIATQTFRSAAGDTANEAVENFRGRLQALAAVSDLMGRDEWSEVDLAEVVEATLSPILGEDLVRRLATEGPATSIPGTKASTLGLILHELATNAIKYGALSNQSASVTVEWRQRGNGVLIEWREDGGPPVRTPESRGFGTTFIERAAQAELGGEAKLHFRPEGLRCQLSIGLAE